MIHPAVVHFSVALLAVGAVMLAYARLTSAHNLSDTAMTLLSLGALATIPAILTGLWNASGTAAHAQHISTHRMLGLATAAVALFALVLHRLRARVTNSDVLSGFLFLCAGAMVLATAYLGGELSHVPHRDSPTVHVHSSANHERPFP